MRACLSFYLLFVFFFILFSILFIVIFWPISLYFVHILLFLSVIALKFPLMEWKSFWPIFCTSSSNSGQIFEEKGLSTSFLGFSYYVKRFTTFWLFVSVPETCWSWTRRATEQKVESKSPHLSLGEEEKKTLRVKCQVCCWLRDDAASNNTCIIYIMTKLWHKIYDYICQNIRINAM